MQTSGTYAAKYGTLIASGALCEDSGSIRFYGKGHRESVAGLLGMDAQTSGGEFVNFVQPHKIYPKSALSSRTAVKGSQHNPGRATPHYNPNVPSCCLKASAWRGQASPAPSRRWETRTGGGVT